MRQPNKYCCAWSSPEVGVIYCTPPPYLSAAAGDKRANPSDLPARDSKDKPDLVSYLIDSQWCSCQAHWHIRSFLAIDIQYNLYTQQLLLKTLRPTHLSAAADKTTHCPRHQHKSIWVELEPTFCSTEKYIVNSSANHQGEKVLKIQIRSKWLIYSSACN